MSNTTTCVKAVLEALGVHLKAGMPNLAQLLYGFPSPNLQLKYPSITLTAAAPLFTPLDPYVLEQGATEDFKSEVKYIVGMYDIPLQLDLWARDKIERFALFEEFFAAFNSQIPLLGVNLQLTQYHGVYCHYDMSGYNLDESEATSQRAEWRARINVLTNTRAVLSKKEFVIDTIENNVAIPDIIIE